MDVTAGWTASLTISSFKHRAKFLTQGTTTTIPICHNWALKLETFDYQADTLNFATLSLSLHIHTHACTHTHTHTHTHTTPRTESLYTYSCGHVWLISLTVIHCSDLGEELVLLLEGTNLKCVTIICHIACHLCLAVYCTEVVIQSYSTLVGSALKL